MVATGTAGRHYGFAHLGCAPVIQQETLNEWSGREELYRLHHAQLVVQRLAYLLECIAHAEARRQATRRVVLKGLHEPADNALGRHVDVAAAEHPFLIVPAGVALRSKFKGILPKIDDARGNCSKQSGTTGQMSRI